MKTKNLKSEQSIDKLIAAVQARECLWDKTYRGHRNRFKLERYWNEVAAEVGTTTANCRKKWKNLKDQCRKEMKKHATQPSEWQHFPKLKFIHDQFVVDDDDEEEANEESAAAFGLDDSIKTPRLGYTMRKKLLLSKRRTIELDLNKLIELVHARDIIWNRQLRGHHNWYKLDECWKEIAQQLGVTRDEARLKWKYVRDQARKECRKQESDWPLLSKLQFLVNQFNECEGTTAEHDPMDQDYSQHYEPMPEEPNNYYFEQQPPVKDDEDIDEFDTKPVIVDTDFYDDDDEPLVPSTSNSEVEKSNDEDVGFFNSLLPHVKKLNPAKKLMLRMKMQELVYNTVYND